MRRGEERGEKIDHMFCDRVTDFEFFERGSFGTKNEFQFFLYEANQSEITFNNQSFIPRSHTFAGVSHHFGGKWHSLNPRLEFPAGIETHSVSWAGVPDQVSGGGYSSPLRC